MWRWRLPGLPNTSLTVSKGGDGTVSSRWADWFRTLAQMVDASARRVQVVSLTAQGAAVTTTTVPIADLAAGLYRLSYALRVARPGTVSSAATVTLGWTDGGVSCTQGFAALTGNTTATTQNGAVLLRVDAGGPLTYAVTYASAGATVMQFQFDLIVEALSGVTA